MKKFQKIKIENFGPIVSTGSHMLEFKRCTVFIGDQGTGKSTIVKIFSCLTWLEKAIISKKDYKNKLQIGDIKKLFSHQNLPDDYFNKNTLIEYCSNVMTIIISNDSLILKEFKYVNSEYRSPQIQYVPSERNIISIIDNLSNISGLFGIIAQFNIEFQNSTKVINNIQFQNYNFIYDKKTSSNYVLTKNNTSKINLKQASSGMHSVFPLLFVSKYLSNSIKKNFFDRLLDTDINRRQIMLNLIKDDKEYNIISNFLISGIDRELKKLNEIEYDHRYGNIIDSCFIEIVEEPEQNLYPLSQVEVLSQLVEDTNGEYDKLVITTHSPYLLSQINNYVFAKKQNDKFGLKVKEIPKSLFIDYNDLSAYKINSGKVKSIIDKEYRGINVLEIDECSRNISKTFDKLVRIDE